MTTLRSIPSASTYWVRSALALVVAATMMVGCQGQPSSTDNALQSEAVPATATQALTPTLLSATDTMRPTLGPHATEVAPTCFIQADTAEPFRPVGWLAFENAQGERAYLRNVATSDLITISTGRSNRLAVSPDGKWLAFIEDGNLQVADPTGGVLVSVRVNPTWESIDKGWLSNQQVLIRPTRQPDSLRESIVVLNPFTNESATLTSDLPSYPNIDAVGPFVPLGIDLRPDPSFRLVAYPDLESTSYRVVDLQTKTTRFSVPTYNSFAHPVIWSHSGYEMALVQAIPRSDAPSGKFGPPEELVIFDTLGRQRLSTDFARHFVDYWLQAYAWSPNDRYLATWIAIASPLSQDAAQSVRLFVLDRTTNSMIEYCVTDDQRDGRSAIVWSPDSQYLVVRSLTTNNQQRPVILKLATGESQILTETDMPDGWMVP